MFLVHLTLVLVSFDFVKREEVKRDKKEKKSKETKKRLELKSNVPKTKASQEGAKHEMLSFYTFCETKCKKRKPRNFGLIKLFAVQKLRII